ncbi:alpha/beta fold hydrolase [Flammeovirga agarivorans]|uniref:Alpha/beta hydrolase n=1 Tax=Flammeovirga agarivorans TaxID=2726742 RepID=A0A7X8SKT6_9BACT|nr:alpha/beta fold hydrolase [Flammeovirga agarivorans]NLR92100.1 alpha/beta hydrolase [Flammeovirga agarivorans]
MKPLIKLLSAAAPNVVVNIAYKKILKPQVFKLRPHEVEIIQQAEEKSITYKGFEVKTYKWGSGKDKLLMVHGWEGQAGNFSDLIQMLKDYDVTIYSFDAPSHGYSSQGPTTMFEFSDLVKYMLETYDIKKVISHSFGSVGTTHCLANYPFIMDKYVMMTTPDRFMERIDDVAEMVGMTNKVKHRLLNRLETEFNVAANEQNVSDFIQKTNIKEGMIFQDINDKIVRLSQSESVAKAWGKNCQLIKIEGTGHFRILRTETVLQQVIDFLDFDKN